MFFDILLLSVIVVTLYMGPMLLRRGGAEQRTYGWMLIVNLAVAVIAFAARQGDADPKISNLLGFVAIAAGVFLVMVPPMVRNLSHWAYRTDRLGLAMVFAGVRELLQPGMGGEQERELFQSMRDVRSGRIDEAVTALRERRDRVEDPLARRRIDERVVMTYLYARRWDDAIAAYESMGGMDAGPTSPGTVAEMVWAYCEAGDMEKAADIVARLEDSPLAQEPLFAPLLQRARLVFLAFVGRTAAVEAIIAPGGVLSPGMAESVRYFWSGVARLNAGDRPGARASLGEAAKRSGRNRRVRELALQRLDTLDMPDALGPHAYPSVVAELADRLAELAAMPDDDAVAPSPHAAAIGHRPVPVTLGLIVANAVAMAIVWALYGDTDSMAALVRGGNLLAGVDVGQWWRLVTSTFLHVGLLHLFLNMYGLWVLGRFVEQIFGSLRYYVIYMVAGIVGMVASHVWSAAPVSAGASGAVLGLAGALLVELGLHGGEYPKRWRTGLFRVLLMLTVANVAIGFVYPAIDQGAHLGGLVTGGLMALWLSPRLRIARSAAMRAVNALLSVALLGVTGYGAYAMATVSYTDTVAAYPVKTQTLNGVVVDAPSLWIALRDGGDDGEGGSGLVQLVDDSGVFVTFELRAAAALFPLEATLDVVIQREQEASRKFGRFDEIAPAKGEPLAVPEPWQSKEFRAIARGPGSDRAYRVIAFGRMAPDGNTVWVGSAYVPEELAGDLRPIFASVLNSARPVEY